MNSKDIKFLVNVFLSWRVLLFVFLFLSIGTYALQMNFLGGGLTSYLKAPYLWSWINFDGEHYLAIAYRGYQPLTYFYFPLFPLITKFAGLTLGRSYTSLAISGLLVSNISLILALVGFWKLVLMDYKKGIAKVAIILLLLFPTSFYFGSFYTESTFLMLAVWSFYFARKKSWFLAGILGAFSTATRIVGLALVPALLLEAWLQKRKEERFNLLPAAFGILLVPLGLFLYMYFLKLTTGDALEFLHSVTIFGQQRSSSLILLPQVFYRYIFKILPNLNYDYFPVVFTTFLEFLVASVFSVLSVLSFFRLRLSYAVYLALGYLIPTFSGSFSSLPRYTLVLFPAFMLLSIYLSKAPRALQVISYSLLFICLAIATALFVRGYWVA